MAPNTFDNPLHLALGDSAGVLLPTAEVQIAEGGSATYSVRLTSRPGGR